MISYEMAQAVTKYKVYRDSLKQGLTEGESLAKSVIASNHKPSVLYTQKVVNSLETI